MKTRIPKFEVNGVILVYVESRFGRIELTVEVNFVRAAVLVDFCSLFAI